MDTLLHHCFVDFQQMLCLQVGIVNIVSFMCLLIENLKGDGIGRQFTTVIEVRIVLMIIYEE